MFQSPSTQLPVAESGRSSKSSTFAAIVSLLLLAVSAFWSAEPAMAQTAIPVLTWRYDNTHAGQNTSETTLTPANVNVNTFGKLFSLAVDSTIYAQPLYVPGLTMVDGKVHNVLFVATENDSLYAFDSDSNGGANSKPIWKVTLTDTAHGAQAGATSIPWNQQDAIYGQGDIGPTIGITGTPVINSATNTMYVVSNTEESGAFYSRLHAINIINGAEQTSPTVAQSPVVISATVSGTGTSSTGGKLSFDPLVDNQRPALDFYNGYVYIGYAAHSDIGPWHGWLFSYNATTMQQSAALCLSANGGGAGIWSSGAGLPIDTDAPGGRMFLVTGNNGPGDLVAYDSFAAGAQLGESILDISLANGGLTPTDAFTSFNSEKLDDGDLDQGSGGILMVPDAAQSNPPILIEAGKEGRILVLNRNNLGGNNSGASANSGDLQDITGEIGGMWSTPAYWNGNVYFWPSKDYPKLFSLTNGVLSGEPATQSTIYSDFPGPSLSISSNGTSNGVAWAVRSDQYVTYGDAVMYAFPANNLTTPIYETDTDSSRDGMGEATKFSIPVVTNGKVYAIAHYAVNVYGLLNGEATTAAPVIAPNGGTFTTSQTVTLTSATAGAQIYYTLDGSTPTTNSSLYSGAITISTDTTLNAIASAADDIQSSISTAVFNFSNEAPTPTFFPAAGTYTSAQKVTIGDTDANAQIYYTLDGSTPSASSTLYTGPITVAVTETVNAIAIDPTLVNSEVATAGYSIQAGGSSINFGNGFSLTTGLTLNGSTLAVNDSRMQLTDGGLNEAGSVFWNTPINIQAFTTSWEFQLSEAQANGYTFTIQNAPAGANALGGNSAGLGYQGITNSVAVKFNFYNYENEGNDSTGFYTNGEPPLTPSIDISPSGIELNSDDLIQATLLYDGTTLTLTLFDPVVNKTFTTSQAINIPQVVGGNTAYVGFTGGSGGLSASQKIASWTYTTQAVPPAFAPPAGTYSGTQNVSLTSATPDAVIYFTTNGTTPTAASAKYSGPIAVVTSGTIESIAISPTMGTSVVETAAYIIQSPAFSMSATTPANVLQGASTTSTVTITPANGFTGSVALTCAVTPNTAGTSDTPTCTASQPASITGTTAVTSTVTIDTQAGTSAASYTATVTGTSGATVQTASIPVTVNAVTAATGFTVAGPAVTIASPGGTGTSTITITPTGAFAGTVAMTCAITSSPSGAVDPPTCSASQPAAISGGNAVTSTLTINTTGSSSAVLNQPLKHLFTFGGGGTLVAALVLFGLPRRRRKLQALLTLLVLSAVAMVAVGCGGSNTNITTTNGTTAGSYTVTVTGTSGSTTAKTAIVVTVQ